MTLSGQIGDTEFLLIDFSFVVDIGARPLVGRNVIILDGCAKDEIILWRAREEPPFQE